VDFNSRGSATERGFHSGLGLGQEAASPRTQCTADVDHPRRVVSRIDPLISSFAPEAALIARSAKRFYKPFKLAGLERSSEGI
jgi:hypothetical protein